MVLEPDRKITKIMPLSAHHPSSDDLFSHSGKFSAFFSSDQQNSSDVFDDYQLDLDLVSSIYSFVPASMLDTFPHADFCRAKHHLLSMHGGWLVNMWWHVWPHSGHSWTISFAVLIFRTFLVASFVPDSLKSQQSLPLSRLCLTCTGPVYAPNALGLSFS